MTVASRELKVRVMGQSECLMRSVRPQSGQFFSSEYWTQITRVTVYIVFLLAGLRVAVATCLQLCTSFAHRDLCFGHQLCVCLPVTNHHS